MTKSKAAAMYDSRSVSTFNIRNEKSGGNN